ncbi:hypothetical protein [Bradyrhizobium amphicarpaeae]|uniref:hypothetical protein n=1 Tax=Bradyrhizobium amphicarpaeae TaxID=1404768 RepID=UPI00138FEA24|nr:hypothetical protein [Bradyrhizobium amphicarpaeae]
MDDEIENLRLHGNRNLLAAQLAPVGIKKVVTEQKLHVENSGLVTKQAKRQNEIWVENYGSAEGDVWFIVFA